MAYEHHPQPQFAGFLVPKSIPIPSQECGLRGRFASPREGCPCEDLSEMKFSELSVSKREA